MGNGITKMRVLGLEPKTYGLKSFRFGNYQNSVKPCIDSTLQELYHILHRHCLTPACLFVRYLVAQRRTHSEGEYVVSTIDKLIRQSVL